MRGTLSAGGEKSATLCAKRGRSSTKREFLLCVGQEGHNLRGKDKGIPPRGRVTDSQKDLLRLKWKSYAYVLERG